LININLLPKELQRVREPAHWRLLTALFPLLAFGIIFFFQFTANQTILNIEAENQQLTDRVLLLQPALAEQQELQRRQAQLRDLIAVAASVREGHVAWSAELTSMLEYLPVQTVRGRPGIDFRSLQMQSIHPPRQDPARYEGAPVIGELTVSGTVAGMRVLEQFIRALEDSPSYGVAFQSASRNREEGSELYDYSLVIGALGSEQE
jgi:Tfp pilus assembly protein PilN